MGDGGKEYSGYGHVELLKKDVCTFSTGQNLKALKTVFRWTINDIAKKFPTASEFASKKFKIDKCTDDACDDYTLSTSLLLGVDDGGSVELNFWIEDIDGVAGLYSNDGMTFKAHVKFAMGDGAYEMNDYSEPPSVYRYAYQIGFPDFIQRDQLLTFVKDDQLVIEASLTIYHHHSEDYQRQNQTLIMLYEAQLGDFVIQCQGKEVKVPKKLLSENSPVLARMLESDMKEAKERILIIDEEKDDLDYDTIASVVKYLYVGELLADMNPAQLLKAAEKYDIVRLKRLCVDRLVCEMTLENVCEMLVLGDLYRAEKLKKAAMALICGDPLTAQSSEGWQKYLAGSNLLLNEVIAELGRLVKKKTDKSEGRKRKRHD